MSWVTTKLVAVTDAWVCLANKTWRSIVGWSVGLSVLTNGVIIPLWNQETVSLSELGLLITACAPIYAVRAIEEQKKRRLEKET